MSRPFRPGLRRRLFVLVYRDAARVHGMGVAAVLLPFVYLWREWPPWLVRSSIMAMPAATQAAFVLLAILAYVRLTRSPVRTLLASQRLSIWRTLPLTRGFWRRTHALHLVLLDVPWLGVIAYAVAPRATTPAVLAWISAAGLTIALQVSTVAFADRPRVRLGLAAALVAVTCAVWLSRSAELAATLGASLFVLAYLRLADPFPEPRARSLRVRPWLGGPGRAWTRLLLVAWLRRHPLALAGTVVGQLMGVAGVVLAERRVGTIDPQGVLLLSRFVAVLGAWLGASALLQAVRALDRDRGWLDALPLPRRAEQAARIGVALVGAAPTWLGLVLVSPAPLEAIVAALWAATAMASLVAGRERARALHDRLVERIVGSVAAALALALAVGHTAVLLPWAAWSMLRADRRLHDAASVRARFETPRTDDDHG
jgi:hypothetical protein